VNKDCLRVDKEKVQSRLGKSLTITEEVAARDVGSADAAGGSQSDKEDLAGERANNKYGRCRK